MTLVLVGAWLTSFPDRNPSATAEARTQRSGDSGALLPGLPGYPQLLKISWLPPCASDAEDRCWAISDLGAEPDRSRGGVRPISARNWTDLGVRWRGGRGGRPCGPSSSSSPSLPISAPVAPAALAASASLSAPASFSGRGRRRALRGRSSTARRCAGRPRDLRRPRTWR